MGVKTYTHELNHNHHLSEAFHCLDGQIADDLDLDGQEIFEVTDTIHSLEELPACRERTDYNSLVKRDVLYRPSE